MTYDIKINLSPSESDLKIIEKWLIEEDKKYKSGFYCNWNIIEKSFRSNELISLKCNENLIGFMIWSKGEIYIEIDIIEIQRGYRKKGFGKIFFEKIEEVFKGKNALAIKLFCEPKESEHFWKKMGFIKFPTRGYSESDLTYYKPLIDPLESTENPNDLNKLELWDVEPYQVRDNKPRWCWNIESENGELLKPIIQPCNVNWNLRWTKNGQIIKEDKVKYFGDSENSIEFCPFMFVEKLKGY